MKADRNNGISITRGFYTVHNATFKRGEQTVSSIPVTRTELKQHAAMESALNQH